LILDVAEVEGVIVEVVVEVPVIEGDDESVDEGVVMEVGAVAVVEGVVVVEVEVMSVVVEVVTVVVELELGGRRAGGSRNSCSFVCGRSRCTNEASCYVRFDGEGRDRYTGPPEPTVDTTR
jgi:hypothetical protein